MISPVDEKTKEYYDKVLFKHEKINNMNVKNNTEYRDNYDGTRLYNRGIAEQYVSKKIQDESEYWKGGKFAYDNKELKDNVIYKTINRQDFQPTEIPEQFFDQSNNMRKTRICEYSNALYNNQVRFFHKI